MNISSIGDITDKILELERKHNLLNFTIGDVKAYQLVRYLIYIYAINSNIDTQTSATGLKKYTLQKIVNKSSRIKNFFLYNPFLDKKKVDVLLLESPRKKEINGKYIDPFTIEVKNAIQKENLAYMVYQTSYSFDRLAKREKNVRHFDYIFLMSKHKANFSKLSINEKDKAETEKLAGLIEKELNLKINLLKLFFYNVNFFQIASKYYSKLLDIKSPEKVYLVNFCDKQALINECKKRKIEVTDIQHGFISSKDIIYHYPDTEDDSLDYFPDVFYSWPEEWLGGCKLPLSAQNIRPVSNYILELEAVKFKNTPKNSKKVIILSQSNITSKVLDETNKLVKANPGFDFFFKPHPVEYSYIKSLPVYNELKSRDNFSIIGINDNLYKHFAEAAHAVGVFSSAVLEAMHFGCKIFIFQIPGSEMMDFLISSGQAKLINSSSGYKF